MTRYADAILANTDTGESITVKFTTEADRLRRSRKPQSGFDAFALLNLNTINPGLLYAQGVLKGQDPAVLCCGCGRASPRRSSVSSPPD